MDKFIQSLTT